MDSDSPTGRTAKLVVYTNERDVRFFYGSGLFWAGGCSFFWGIFAGSLVACLLSLLAVALSCYVLHPVFWHGKKTIMFRYTGWDNLDITLDYRPQRQERAREQIVKEAE